VLLLNKREEAVLNKVEFIQDKDSDDLIVRIKEGEGLMWVEVERLRALVGRDDVQEWALKQVKDN
jgi:hypothetical protein